MTALEAPGFPMLGGDCSVLLGFGQCYCRLLLAKHGQPAACSRTPKKRLSQALDLAGWLKGNQERRVNHSSLANEKGNRKVIVWIDPSLRLLPDPIC